MAEASPRARDGVDSLPDFLVGTWARTLQWREFGGEFESIASTNSVVRIEDDADALAEPGSRFLKWSFSKRREDPDFVAAYTMHFIPQDPGYFMEWNFQGCRCFGNFHQRCSVASLNFSTRSAVVTITYRIISQDVMAVSVVDVDVNSQTMPSVQVGRMMRIRVND